MKSLVGIKNRKCTYCGIEKPFTKEYFTQVKIAKTGLASICKSCNSKKKHEYILKHPKKREQLRIYEKTWREKHPGKYKEKSRNYQRRKWKERPEQARKYQNEYRKKVRENLVIAYGGKCTCCGEDEMKFLALDHINNDGAEQRRKIGAGIQMYLYIKRNMPKDIQVLCHNCNSAKQFYGKCPHKN